MRLLRLLLCCVASLATASSVLQGQTEDPSPRPSYDPSEGYLPYHQLTTDDFPIREDPDAKKAAWIEVFLIYKYGYQLSARDGWFFAYVTEWNVRSGLNRNKSYRKRSLLPADFPLSYFQGFLDLNELHAHRLAAMKPGELPSGRGAGREAAEKSLAENLGALHHQVLTDRDVEFDTYAAVTQKGGDKKRIQVSTKDLKQRLKKAGIGDNALASPAVENSSGPPQQKEAPKN